jgi:hypothetical protein
MSFYSPLFWGGDMVVCLTAVIAAGPVPIEVPVHVSGLQLRALARLTLKPLIDVLPCVGGVTVSLMEEPHVDCEVSFLSFFLAFLFILLDVCTAISLQQTYTLNIKQR